MKIRQKLLTLTAITAATAVALAGCSSGGGAQGTTSSAAAAGSGGSANQGPKAYTFAFITHETPGDTFWDKIKAGMDSAAKNHNITIKYSSDPSAAGQATLIQNAVDSKVDGIATTLVTPDALAGAVKTATDAGIPVVGLNSGIDQYKDLGALMYFGSDEALAGEQAGERATAAGAKHILCVIQAEGSVALENRCAGVLKGAPGTENLQVNGADLSSVTSTITAKLQQDPSIDYMITLGAPIALAAIEAKSSASSSVKIGTFDLNPDAAKAVADGTLEFAIDQQPYLQGYEAVDSLWLYLTNKNDIGGGRAVLTGPSFVDKTNIEAISALAQAGTR
jgi:simple sugar transport system substrate-binding protein